MSKHRRPRLCRHRTLTNVRETGCVAEDLIAGTGRISYEGVCTRCQRTVGWEESNV